MIEWNVCDKVPKGSTTDRASPELLIVLKAAVYSQYLLTWSLLVVG